MNAVEKAAKVLAEHWRAETAAARRWECTCGEPIERTDEAHQAHVAQALADAGLLTDTAEVKQLRRWKAEALPVLTGLQELGKALNLPLGEQITGESALWAVRKLKHGRATTQRANAELLHERNTWARQLADVSGERDDAAEQSEKHRQELVAIRNERDDLSIQVDEVRDLAESQVISCRAAHQANHARNWSKVLRLLPLPAEGES